VAGEVFTLQVAAGCVVSASAPDPLPGYLLNAGLNYWCNYSAPNHLLYFSNQRLQRGSRPPLRGNDRIGIEPNW
jgi:hypothetical protein